MPARHLDRLTLERMVAARLARAQMLEAGRHLFKCASCRNRLRVEIPGGAKLLQRLVDRWPGGSREQYDPVFERIHARALDRVRTAGLEQADAEALAEELAELAPQAGYERIQNDPRFANAALADRLLECSRLLWGEDAVHSERLARLALAVAGRLDPAVHGRGLICDLQARSWAFIGNALRVRSDLAAAEAALLKAESLLDEGSCEPLERALVLDLKTSLLRAQRRLGEALETIRQVTAIYRRVRDPHLEGRALVGEAMILGYAGEPQKAIETLRTAVAKIDPAREPYLAYATRHNLAFDLAEAGRSREALVLLPEVRRMEKVGRPQDRIRLVWIEGKIERDLGQFQEAEEKLVRVQAEYLHEGDGYLASLVSLDLAQLYLEQGRTAETRQLAVQMKSIFVAKDIRREALAALLVFQRAAEHEVATVLLVQDVARRIKQVQDGPEEPERPA